mmetsp:Transcript_97720/g.271891  ORF Transcript_97720/g.271891 Transcript_97720/m.271891 type:complete len:157 (+) Transcript_97720:73-543(+)
MACARMFPCCASDANYKGAGAETVGGDLSKLAVAEPQHIPDVSACTAHHDLVISLSKGPDDKLGLLTQLDKQRDVIRVRRVKLGGLVDKWNKDHPDQALGPNDIIVAVNDMELDAQAMTNAVANTMGNLSLAIRRSLAGASAVNCDIVSGMSGPTT